MKLRFGKPVLLRPMPRQSHIPLEMQADDESVLDNEPQFQLPVASDLTETAHDLQLESHTDDRHVLPGFQWNHQAH